jgi:hypothetical protein
MTVNICSNNKNYIQFSYFPCDPLNMDFAYFEIQNQESFICQLAVY